MAEFKGIAPIAGSSRAYNHLQPHQLALRDGAFQAYTAGADIESGGIAVLDTGQIVEVRSPLWNLDQNTAVPAHLRTSATLLWMTDTGIELRPRSAWSPHRPVLGDETEMHVRSKYGSYDISPDGLSVQSPHGTDTTLTHLRFQAEALQSMVEIGTPPTAGINQHHRVALRTELAAHVALHSRGLYSPPVGVAPDVVTRQKFSQLPYIQLTTSHERMPYAPEIAATASNQLHVPMLSPNAAQAALSYYQAVQTVVTVGTESSPSVRDGKFGTTLYEHYRHNPDPDYVCPPGADGLMIEFGSDCQPRDWRTLGRRDGSPRGGVYHKPLELTIEATLSRADRELRTSQQSDNGQRLPIISLERAAGPHCDRPRYTLATIETCGPGLAGGHFAKRAAFKQMTIGLLTAMQLQHARTSGTCRPLFSGTDGELERTLACTVGRVNERNGAIYGKSAELCLPDGSDKLSQSEMVSRIDATIQQTMGSGLQPHTLAEILATLQPAPTAARYKGQTAENVFDDFYRPHSPFTAGEAFDVAHAVQPELTIDELCMVMDVCHLAHLRRVARRIGC